VKSKIISQELGRESLPASFSDARRHENGFCARELEKLCLSAGTASAVHEAGKLDVALDFSKNAFFLGNADKISRAAAHVFSLVQRIIPTFILKNGLNEAQQKNSAEFPDAGA